MRCMIHSEREAVTSCANCGREYCAECLVELNEGKLCKECVASLAGGDRRKYKAHGPASHYHYTKPHAVYGKKERRFSKFLMFILSFHPGLGYMYLGMIKRGLFVMSTFYLLIFLANITDAWMLMLAMPILFFASFFDGFRILRQINAGEVVEDSIDDMKDFMVTHKSILLCIIGAIVAFSVLSNVLSWRIWRALPLLLIAAGVYFFTKRNKGNMDGKQ